MFRVDFGFVFGATPEIDSPQTVVARAVTYALGVERWMEVVAACALDLERYTMGLYVDKISFMISYRYDIGIMNCHNMRI